MIRNPLVPAIFLGLIGVALAAYVYLPFGSGVEGTVGALLALLGAIAVTFGCILMASQTLRGVLFGVLALLVGVGAALTAVAGFFLMQYGLSVVMGLCLLGVLVGLRPARQRGSV